MPENRCEIAVSDRGFGRFRFLTKYRGFGYGTVPVTALLTPLLSPFTNLRERICTNLPRSTFKSTKNKQI